MVVATTEHIAPAPGDPGYESWRRARSNALDQYIIRALLEAPKKWILQLHRRGGLMVNVADVVHESIKPQTVVVRLCPIGSQAQPVQESRHCLVDFRHDARTWSSTLGIDFDSAPHWIIQELIDAKLGELPLVDIRAAAAAHALRSDVVGVVRQRMKSRYFSQFECS